MLQIIRRCQRLNKNSYVFCAAISGKRFNAIFFSPLVAGEKKFELMIRRYQRQKKYGGREGMNV